jgi:hypothetical protein
MEYSDNEIFNIVNAYKYLLPEPDEDLRRYLGLSERERPHQKSLPYLTTDFHNFNLDEFKEFNFSVSELRKRNLNDIELQNELKKLIIYAFHSRYGISLGLNQYNDDLLLRCFKPRRKSIIYIAHDWYPLIYRKIIFNTPLEKVSMFEAPNLKYGKKIPLEEISKKYNILFFNLVPDFRLPNSAQIGKFLEDDSYKDCTINLLKMIDRIASRSDLGVAALITWGKIAMYYLKGFEDYYKNIYRDLRNDIDFYTLKVGSREIPFFPAVHPSAPAAFSKHRHYYDDFINQIIS